MPNTETSLNSTEENRRLIPFEELTETSRLQEGDTITGLSIPSDYDSLELIVALNVSPTLEKEKLAFLRSPLSTKLWPKKFIGDLKGTVTILGPELNESDADSDKAPTIPTRTSTVRLRVNAEMHSSVRPIEGSIQREFAYFRRYRKADIYGDVGRTVGSNEANEAAEVAAEVGQLASTATANQVTRRNLSCPYRG